MNGCVYRTKDDECDLWTDNNHTSWCDFENCDDKHPSNAERLRAMTDEELAKFLRNMRRRWTCLPGYKGCYSATKTCEECWLDWLIQEVQDEDDFD